MVVGRYFHPREAHSASRALRRRTRGADAWPCRRADTRPPGPRHAPRQSLPRDALHCRVSRETRDVIPRGRSSKNGAPTSDTQLEARHEATATTSPHTAAPFVQHGEAAHPNSPRVSREATETPAGPFGRVMICDCGRVEVTDGLPCRHHRRQRISADCLQMFHVKHRVRSAGSSDAREGGPLFHVKPAAALPLLSLRASDSWVQQPRHHLECTTPPMLGDSRSVELLRYAGRTGRVRAVSRATGSRERHTPVRSTEFTAQRCHFTCNNDTESRRLTYQPLPVSEARDGSMPQPRFHVEPTKPVQKSASVRRRGSDADAAVVTITPCLRLGRGVGRRVARETPSYAPPTLRTRHCANARCRVVTSHTLLRPRFFGLPSP